MEKSRVARERERERESVCVCVCECAQVSLNGSSWANFLACCRVPRRSGNEIRRKTPNLFGMVLREAFWGLYTSHTLAKGNSSEDSLCFIYNVRQKSFSLVPRMAL